MIRGLLNSIRQNHALEHATLHLLARRSPGIRLVGRSGPSGFALYGPADTGDVEAAAAEALARLQGGDAHLAVHPNCGTNAVVTGVLVGGSAFAAGLGKARSRWERLPLVLLVATLAAVVAQPLAHLVQERVTTSPALQGAHLVDVRREGQGGLLVHRIRVRRG